MCCDNPQVTDAWVNGKIVAQCANCGRWWER